MEHYHIKPNYQTNSLQAYDTHDLNYWNIRRVASSKMFQSPVYKYLQHYLNNTKTNTLVDIGCGIGTKLLPISKAYPKLQIIGIDSPSAINYALSHHDFGQWHPTDLNSNTLPLLSDIPLIICSDVIEHVIDPDHLITYMKTILDPNGTIILSTPERDSLRGNSCNISPNPDHIREWNAEEFRTYLTSRGLEIKHQSFLLPVKIYPNKIFYNEVIKRFNRFKPVKTCQLIVAGLQ